MPQLPAAEGGTAECTEIRSPTGNFLAAASRALSLKGNRNAPAKRKMCLPSAHISTEKWIEEDTVSSAGELTNWTDSYMVSAHKFYTIRID